MGPGILKTLTQFIMMVLTPMAVTKIQLKIAMIVAFHTFDCQIKWQKGSLSDSKFCARIAIIGVIAVFA
jgi:hypothetical protein